MRTNPPRPTKGTFPPSWKRWRALKAGERVRSTDRVVFQAGRIVRSLQMGRCSGMIVNRPETNRRSTLWEAGYYYRKVN